MTQLRARVAPRAALNQALVDAMWGLFDAAYADVDRPRFEADLAAKAQVILVEDTAGTLCGFSTLCVDRHDLDGAPFVAIYSGDTVMAEGVWGQTALQGAFFAVLLATRMAHPELPVYWHLISKGFKTYLLLARNFPHAWPHRARPTPPREAAILDQLCRLRFGAAWDPARGTLRFATPQGRLRAGVAPIDDRAAADPDVQYFLARNPGWAAGEELCCLGAVDAALVDFYQAKLARRR